ncbi:Na/Pi cotransporter family protein [Treponema zioleckii]|uniref:Na/Pi cotransporter family protein n=1 Tax=Treponema zioleckii TaxID=331680 RepID=UPI001F5B0AA9|nr:Na/Pi symporter [Treponema zioleckii]
MIFNILAQTLGFIGALCLLLFGMSMLSDGIQKGAGKELQRLLGKIAGNRFTALLTGIGITAIVQSSGATTVMVVSFVNAEILTLNQAIGVIFGANIGTTVTAWIVSFFGFSFSISAAAIPIFGIGYLIKKFKRLKIHNFADCFMGFALLFMGLDLLKASLSLNPSSAEILKNLSSLKTFGLFVGVLIGAFITALIHSSSATTAIVLTMAANGSLSWELSASLVLGSNIGSTIDAVMSAIGASTNAKRTALVHVGFNTAGTFIILCFFKPFLALVDSIVPGTPETAITTHIAMLHTIFNFLATLIFLPFVNQIASLNKKNNKRFGKRSGRTLHASSHFAIKSRKRRNLHLPDSEGDFKNERARNGNDGHDKHSFCFARQCRRKNTGSRGQNKSLGKLYR